MVRTRMIAIVLTIAMLLCVPVFSASAENEACRISVVFFGSGCVTLNGTDHYDSFYEDIPMGTSVTLVAEPEEGFEFLYWVNRETERIVSWDATYTFSAATYVNYQAVFDEDEATAAANGIHTVVYLSEGENIVFAQPVMIGDADYIDEVETAGMYVLGKIWDGWDHEPNEVAQSSERIFVRPVYKTAEDFKFTITSIIDGETTLHENVPYRSTYTLNAPQTLNGQQFSYWIAHARTENDVDEIASFYATYNFIVTMDVTFEAVYGEPVDVGISARVSGDFPVFNESSVTIFAEHSVTRDYTVLQHGMLLTKDLEVGSFPDTFVINPSDSRIRKGTSNNTNLVGTYSLTVGNWHAQSAGSYTYYPMVFARAYVMAADKNGNVFTVYSQIYCVDYVRGTGTIGGDPIDDPLG